MQICVAGLPLPKGSGSRKLAPASCPRCDRKLPPHLGRLGPFVESANLATKSRRAGALKSWEAMVRETARAKLAGSVPLSGPVSLYVRFSLPRPKSVKRAMPYVKPDLSKLTRAVEDALNGFAYKDDSQVVRLDVRKEYSEDGYGSAVIAWNPWRADA